MFLYVHILTLLRLILRSLRSSPLNLLFLFSFSGERSSISLLPCLFGKIQLVKSFYTKNTVFSNEYLRNQTI